MYYSVVPTSIFFLSLFLSLVVSAFLLLWVSCNFFKWSDILCRIAETQTNIFYAHSWTYFLQDVFVLVKSGVDLSLNESGVIVAMVTLSISQTENTSQMPLVFPHSGVGNALPREGCHLLPLQIQVICLYLISEMVSSGLHSASLMVLWSFHLGSKEMLLVHYQ